MRHAQRVSFAIGNLAIDRPETEVGNIARSVRAAAGACPCSKCQDVRAFRGKAWNRAGGSTREVLNGSVMSGEIEAK